MSTWIYDPLTKTKKKVAGKEPTPNLSYLTEEDIDNLLQSAAAREWSYLASLIVDDAVSLKKVWSSSKIAEEIAANLVNSKIYTDEQIAKFKTASYRMVDSTAEMVDSSVLYLLPVVGSNYYDIYALVDDVPKAIGTTQIQLTDYYTKSEINTDFLKKEDGITKTKYLAEVGNTADLDDDFEATNLVGAVNELLSKSDTFEDTDIDFQNDW